MVGVISQVENGCQVVANSLLVLAPHKTLHGTISFLIQRTRLAANVGKTRAVKNKMPLIPQRPGLAHSAETEMPGDGWSSKPTLFRWQSMRPHAELHQQLQPGNGHEKLKVRHSRLLTGAQKPCKVPVCAKLGPHGGSCSWGDMQTTPNLLELTLHVCLEPEGVQACNARR